MQKQKTIIWGKHLGMGGEAAVRYHLEDEGAQKVFPMVPGTTIHSSTVINHISTDTGFVFEIQKGALTGGEAAAAQLDYRATTEPSQLAPSPPCAHLSPWLSAVSMATLSAQAKHHHSNCQDGKGKSP